MKAVPQCSTGQGGSRPDLLILRVGCACRRAVQHVGVIVKKRTCRRKEFQPLLRQCQQLARPASLTSWQLQPRQLRVLVDLDYALKYSTPGLQAPLQICTNGWKGLGQSPWGPRGPLKWASAFHRAPFGTGRNNSRLRPRTSISWSKTLPHYPEC
jgi:hypothetical protein